MLDRLFYTNNENNPIPLVIKLPCEIWTKAGLIDFPYKTGYFKPQILFSTWLSYIVLALGIQDSVESLLSELFSRVLLYAAIIMILPLPLLKYDFHSKN